MKSKPLIRLAELEDLPRIVEIYNMAIPGRMATADLEPITWESRVPWFHEHNQGDRPLWVYMNEAQQIQGWISLNSFYGRPAYQYTTEVSIYIASQAQGQGIGTALVESMLFHATNAKIKTIVAFVFAHNSPSLRLLDKFEFERWGYCPRIAELDQVERDLVILGKRLISS